MSASISAPLLAQPLVCYLPQESNVSYTQVLALPSEQPDEILAYGDSALQFGELWLPNLELPKLELSELELSKLKLPKLVTGVSELENERAIKSPLVILLHGGCWLNAYDIKHTHALSTALSNSGYAVWAPEYRRTGDEGGGWPGSFEDVENAINFILKQNIAGVDMNKVALVGHSAGGHLALLAGATLDDSVAAVIGLAAIVDIETYAKGSNSCEVATPQFMGGSALEKPQAYASANPLKQKLHPNTVLLHGSKDSIVPLEQALNLPENLVTVDGAGHFDMIHSGTPAFQELLKQLAKALP